MLFCNIFLFLLIGGITITSAFNVPFDNTHVPLGNEKLDWYRKNLCNLKLIIIDEISLVKADMLYQLHTRLCEIFQKPTNVPFANISVIVVGDLLQVRKNNNFFMNDFMNNFMTIKKNI